MNLPQGFILESEQEGPKLPEGFVLENGPIQKMNETKPFGTDLAVQLGKVVNPMAESIPHLLSPGDWLNTFNNAAVNSLKALGVYGQDRQPYDFHKVTDIGVPNMFQSHPTADEIANDPGFAWAKGMTPEEAQNSEIAKQLRARYDGPTSEPDIIPGALIPGMGIGVQGGLIDARLLQSGGQRGIIPHPQNVPPQPRPPMPEALKAVGGVLAPASELMSGVMSGEGAPLLVLGGEGVLNKLVQGILAGQMAARAPESVVDRFQQAKRAGGGVGEYTKAGVGSVVDVAAPTLLARHGSAGEGLTEVEPTETNLRTGDVDEMQGRVPPERQLAFKNAQTILGEILSQQERQSKAASEYPNFLVGPKGIVQQGDIGGLHNVAQPNIRGLLMPPRELPAPRQFDVPQETTFTAGPTGVAQQPLSVAEQYQTQQPRPVVGLLRAPALESGPTTLPKTLTEVEKLLKGEEADLPTKRQTFRSGMGADEDAAKMLLPAVKFGGRILTGKQGDTHAEILERNGIGPDVVPHSSADRGFLLNGEWLSRQQAAEKMGKTGTADVGGIDSMDLPNAGKFRALRSAGMSKEEVNEILGDDAKFYSGVPVFDPEMWGSTEEAKRAKDKFDRMVLSRKDAPPEVKASAKASLREKPTELQSVRAKEILESKTAVKNEPFAKSGRQPGEPRTVETKAKNVAATVGNFSRDLGRRLAPWDVLMDQMDGGQAKFDGPIFKNVRRAADNQFNERQKLEWSLRDELKNVRKEFKLDDLSAERINVYSVAQQPGGIERMVKTGVKQETIDKVLGSMTKGELAYYKARRTLYDKTGPSIQQVAKDVDDVNVKLVPNYTPWERAWEEYIPEADELAKNPNIPANATPSDVLWPGLAEVGDTRQTPQSLIRRLRSAKSPLKMNAFEVDDRYIADYAHYITMRKFLKETSNIVRDEKFVKKYGKNNQDLMMDWVNTTARNGKFMAGDWGHVMNWLRRSTAAGALILRPASAIVHTTNISFAIEKIGPGWFARGLDEAWTERGQKFLKQHFAESFTSGEPGINEVTVEGIRPGNLVSRLRSKGFAPQRAIDSTMRFGVNLGYYMKALKEQGKDPNAYDKLPVDQNAVEIARVMARRAVASPYAKDVPPAITGGGATRRAFFQFQNMFLDQLSNLTYEGGQVGLKKLLKDKDPRMTASVLLAFTTMLVAETGIKYAQKRGMQAIAGKEPDDKEFQKMLAEEALKRIPAYTQIKGSVGDYGEIGVPALDVPRDAVRSGVKAFNATESGDRIIQGTRAAKGVGELLVPGAGMIGDVTEAAERRMLYEPHDKKLSKASGKKVEDMGWKERYDAEKAFAKTREPMSAEARAKSAERNIGNVVKRGSELLKSVNKADRQWIESRGLSMPGYDNKIREGGTSVYLTKDEMKKMEVYVKEAVEEKMQIVRRKPDVYSQQKNFSELMSSAHAKARSRIIKEIKSHSENESNNNRYSAFRP